MITVREALEKDYPVIARIQADCPQAAQWPVGDYSAYRVLMAQIDHQPAGFCVWRQTSADEAELLNLGVDPRYRRRGVASALMLELARIADGDIFLEAAEDNTAALGLYSNHGWQKIGVREGYYSAGATNAIVMKKCSC